MPCSGCGKQKNSVPSVTLLNIQLDSAELALQAAWITDVDPEQREVCSQLIRAIQLLKHPHVVPLEMQLDGLVRVSNQVGWKILCHRCRMVYYYDIVKGAEFHLRIAEGKRWQAAKAYVDKEIKGKYWLLRALLRV